MTENAVPGAEPGRMSRRRFAWMFVPAAAFALILAVFGWGLVNGNADLPSTLIGKPVPDFNLPPVQGRNLGMSAADVKGEVSIVNVFASWCVPCRIEHPLILEINRTGAVPIHGINYKDQPKDVAAWLDELGDPYTRTGADLDGRAAIDWGVYGIPETFVVGADGRIAYKHIGPISRSVVDEKILPLVRELQAKAEKGDTR